ncbi:hypothetical protein DMH17_05445 [Raoultella planticola]|nr:hypothetical protein [Raoultella planticola]
MSKHIISINDLSREDLELVTATAAKLKANPQPELLKHKVIASCFFEASTRTRLSFETSMHRSAPAWWASPTAATSLGKRRNPGRHHFGHQHLRRRHRDASPAGRASRLATEFSGGIPVLNAGDGANQHRRRPCWISSPSGNSGPSGKPQRRDGR